MTPRKRRERYRERARKLQKARGEKFDANDWETIWQLCDEHERDEKPVYVYAIADNALRVVKFGKSQSPGARLRAIKTGNPADLKLCGFCVERGELTEKFIHERLSEHRIGGEWFRLNEHSERVIKEIRTAAGL